MRTYLSAAAGFACLALAACGGSDKAAPAPTQATAAEVGALGATLAGANGLSAAPSSALLLADPSSATDILLGAPNLGIPLPMGTTPRALSTPRSGPSAAALVSSGFDDPTCLSVTAGLVTFANCTITMDVSGQGVTAHISTAVNGTASLNPLTGTFAWDLRLVSDTTASGTHTAAVHLDQHLSGTLTATATTLSGHIGGQFRASGTVDGTSVAAGFDESLDVNVTTTDALSCSSRITAGTLTASRTWITRPAGMTAAQLPDVSATVTWTGCGQATIQRS